MLPLSPEPMRSSTGNSIESVEQPWAAGATANPVRHGTVPDLAAVAARAGGASGQTVSREIAG